MSVNREESLEQEIQEKIAEINQKIDAELLDAKKTDMSLVDEYLKQIRALDGMPETSEEKLEAELRQLYQKADLPKRRKCYWRLGAVGCRAASILLVIGVFSIFSMGVYAARAPFVQFLSNSYDRYIELFFDQPDVEKAPSEIETVYTLGFVPEGYEKKTCEINKCYVSIAWECNEDESIIFKQRILGGFITMDNEYGDYSSEIFNDINIIYRCENNSRYYFWNSEKYSFSLEVPDSVAHDIALEIIDSVMRG